VQSKKELCSCKSTVQHKEMRMNKPYLVNTFGLTCSSMLVLITLRTIRETNPVKQGWPTFFR
jgi:hypothetical protein